MCVCMLCVCVCARGCVCTYAGGGWGVSADGSCTHRLKGLVVVAVVSVEEALLNEHEPQRTDGQRTTS